MRQKKDIKVFIPEYAKRVMDSIKEEGENVYIVGGCLRDALLSREPQDYDMTVSCLPQRTAEILSSKGFRTVATGIQHGTVTAISEGEPIEITTFRIDGEYQDSRHPQSVSFTGRLADDLCRRDFTVNAMAYNDDGGLVDLFGGEEDLRAGVIRAVGDPCKRFSEDALRIMRAFRFSAQLGFEIENDTLAGAKICKDGLKNISRERICTELLKLLMSDSPKIPLELMYQKGIFDVISHDSIDANAKAEWENRYREIFSLIEKMPKNEAARLGLLLCLWGENGEEGARKFTSSLKCSNKLSRTALAVYSGAFKAINTSVDASRLVAAIGREAALYAVTASVLLKNSPEGADNFVRESRVPASVSELAIGGRELAEMGIEGKKIGEILGELHKATIEGVLENEREKLLSFAQGLNKESFL